MFQFPVAEGSSSHIDVVGGLFGRVWAAEPYAELDRRTWEVVGLVADNVGVKRVEMSDKTKGDWKSTEALTSRKHGKKEP